GRGLRKLGKPIGLAGKLFVYIRSMEGWGGGMWFRVLAARYGVVRGRVKEGGRGESSWWREIVKIRDDIGGLGGVCVKVSGQWGGYIFLDRPLVRRDSLVCVGVVETVVGVGGEDVGGVSNFTSQCLAAGTFHR
ncbi:hypothetical protein A2U01_0029260, partial [Trifolium medium]|nr:hypothetical protein [Trifolium medium]